MARRPKFDEEKILHTALALLVQGGPRAVTVAGIARHLGAPSGSIYHRFASRDLLLAALWLDTVRSFQAGYLAALATSADPKRGLSAAVRFVLQWCRAHRAQAQLLLLHRRQDLVDGDWPPAVADRAAALGTQVENGIRDFLRTAWPDGSGDPHLMRLAAISIPQGAVLPYLRDDKEIPDGLDDAVVCAALAALDW